MVFAVHITRLTIFRRSYSGVSSEPLKKDGAGWSQYAVRIVLNGNNVSSGYSEYLSGMKVSRFFSRFNLLLSLYFFQFCENVGPEVEDFARKSFEHFRSSGGDEGRKPHGIELAMPGFGDIVKL
jgi:hypothetical protein